MSRYEIYKQRYEHTIGIEAEVALTMAKTMIIPAVLDYQNSIANTIKSLKKYKAETTNVKVLLREISILTEGVLAEIKKLEKAITLKSIKSMISAMDRLRGVVDELEGMMPDDIWPLPSYAQMLFMI